MWFSFDRVAPLLLWRGEIGCIGRFASSLCDGSFWWWGGVACADRESEWRFKWSLETVLDFV